MAWIKWKCVHHSFFVKDWFLIHMLIWLHRYMARHSQLEPHSALTPSLHCILAPSGLCDDTSHTSHQWWLNFMILLLCTLCFFGGKTQNVANNEPQSDFHMCGLVWDDSWCVFIPQMTKSVTAPDELGALASQVTVDYSQLAVQGRLAAHTAEPEEVSRTWATFIDKMSRLLYTFAASVWQIDILNYGTSAVFWCEQHRDVFSVLTFTVFRVYLYRLWQVKNI